MTTHISLKKHICPAPQTRGHKHSMVAGGDPAPPIAVPWDRLRSWISEREANPLLPLTRTQVQALSLLIPFDDEEPEMDSADHVSRLHCLVQARRLSAPVFHDLDPVEIPVAGSFALRWRSICVLPEACVAEPFTDGFPAFGFGIREASQGAPLFKSKKVAKQYAARHAHLYLQANPPKASSSPSSTTVSSPARLTASASASPPSSVFPPTSSPSPTSGSAVNRVSEFSDDKRVFEKVAALAGHLGIEGPRFVPEETSTPGIFNARADFRNNASVPPGLGVVKDILGKAMAKRESAEKVLAWLEAEKQKRDKRFNEVVATP